MKQFNRLKNVVENEKDIVEVQMSIETARGIVEEFQQLLDDMEHIYNIAAEDGIHKKLDLCYILARKYVKEEK
ncbi:hypothetical protein CPT_Pookie44 [Bacillus phage Pookie]|uniref:Uncharacterized protein n=1 Tax=Bacillus phage Pookie TaxID=1540093 RepID=A0A0A0RQ13_9CAUD|nr:hypothetical protein CPT_Pookie44 [Bacillus phage Pookie]AIW03729.1 hypothetical protein CPT_Pookie44 [Bacillus phage Pookie]